MPTLLVDNSNTRTKFALCSPDALLDWRTFIPTREVSPDTLTAALAGVEFDRAIVCSVVPRVSGILEDWFQVPVLQVNHLCNLGLGIDYPRPRQIGADRLANSAGFMAKYKAPGIVVDFGTAVTFDVISENACYAGGVIAPGLAAMSEYLGRNTALLPAIQPHEPTRAIGKSTEEALHAGAVYGYRGLVKEILSKLQLELSAHALVIATGGDAQLIAAGVPEIISVEPDLTLEGLRTISNLNPAS